MLVSVQPEPLRPIPGEHRDAALAGVYLAEYARLVGLARLLVDRREQAEEIVQDAFTRTYAAIDRVRDDDLLPYVRQAVVNVARSALRRRRTARSARIEPQPDAASAEWHTIRGEQHRELAAAVRALPRRQRECVVLRYYLDCSTAETAAALGISTGSVKTNLHRALAALGIALEEER